MPAGVGYKDLTGYDRFMRRGAEVDGEVVGAMRQPCWAKIRCVPGSGLRAALWPAPAPPMPWRAPRAFLCPELRGGRSAGLLLPPRSAGQPRVFRSHTSTRRGDTAAVGQQRMGWGALPLDPPPFGRPVAPLNRPVAEVDEGAATLAAANTSVDLHPDLLCTRHAGVSPLCYADPA